MKPSFFAILLLTLVFGTGALVSYAQNTDPEPQQDPPNQVFLPLIRTPPLKIAAQFPLSGTDFNEGISLRNAAELGVTQLITPLNELGIKVEFVAFDDAGAPQFGARNARDIIADPTIMCVNGHFNSGVALEALPIYASASLPMVSPANTVPAITDSFTNSFRLVGRDDVQGAIGALFPQIALNANSIYIVSDTSSYGLGIAESLRSTAQTEGLTVTGFVSTTATSVFDPLFPPIQAANPDVLYFAGGVGSGGSFFRQARERGNITAQFLGPDALDTPDLLSFGGRETISGTYVTALVPPVRELTTTAQLQFVSDFTARYGSAPRALDTKAYDASGVCVQAIAAAARTAGRTPTRAEVLAAMRSLPAYQGISGTYQFNANGDPAQVEYYIVQVNGTNWDLNDLIFTLPLPAPTPTP